MNVIPFPGKPVRLADSPVDDRRARLVPQMAADLVAAQATNSEREAIRALTGRYPFYDIALFAEDALFAARQQLVMREMRQR